MSSRIGMRAAIALGAIVFWGWIDAQEAGAAFENVYTSGHADIGVVLEDDNTLYLHYHFGANAVINGSSLGPGLDDEDYEFDPSTVTTIVSEQAQVVASGALPFLGVAAGETYWNLPQSSNPLLPFLGIATEELVPGDWTGFSFALTGFSGPGQFALYQFGPSGSNVFWDTIDGIDATDTLPIGLIGGHDHYNFGFSAEGLYDVTITASGTHRTLGLLSDTATFRFNVGPVSTVVPVIPEPASIAMMGLGAIGVLGSVLVRRSRSRAEGAEAA